MKLAVEEPEAHQATAHQGVIREHIRGSSLLLGGRVLAIGINLASQVLVVRYLSRADYGAWAYALSLVVLLQTIAPLGLHRAVNRFVPLYHEERDYGRMFGTVALAFGAVILVGSLAISTFYLFPSHLSHWMGIAEKPFDLLLVLILVAPLEAMDGLLTSLFASFGRPQSIFFRKYVLGPALRFAAVAILIGIHSGVRFLAWGYLGASLVGIAIYLVLLVRTWEEEGLLAKLRLSELKVPLKDLFSYTLPLMTSEIRTTVNLSASTLILGYYWSVTEVGIFRVVLPIATAVTTVFLQTFTMLYTPALARLFARQDHESANDLYWRTTCWLAVLSFPVFAAAFCLARPLTVLVYGHRYEPAAIILTLLIAGTYFDAALGFNKLTLQIMGKTQLVMFANLGSAVVNLFLSLILIPRFGARGAAVAASATLILYNLTMQVSLRQVPGLRSFDRRYGAFYLSLGLACGGLVMFRASGIGNLLFGVVVVALGSLMVLGLSRKHLEVRQTFPELLKFPMVRALVR